jgi:ADP-ribosylglycohydrolase
MTEDGSERHRLMCTAIIEKGGRIDIWDLARVWRRDIDGSHFGYLLGNQDRIFYDLFSAGFPPTESGRYADWPGFIGTAKMMLPVGLVNACNPREAARDALNLGRIKDRPHTPGNYALEVCAALAAACAEAVRPAANVATVLEEAKRHLSPVPLAAIEEGLAWAEQAETVWDLRTPFADKYRGLPQSNAVEVLAAGLSILAKVGGDTRQAILAAVNFGRDCDCMSYLAAGLSGAIGGIDSVPAEWVKVIEDELPSDPYTVSRRSLADTANGLYQAALNEMNRAKVRLANLSLATGEA